MTILELASNPLTRVLGLDLGNTTGWADHAGNSGSWSIWRKDQGARPAAALDDLVSILNRKIDELRPDVICYEEISAGGSRRSNYRSTKKMDELMLVLRITAERRGVPLKGFYIGTIKNFATGDGRAEKSEMMASYLRHYGVDMLGDDNRCDAAWIVKLFFRPDCWPENQPENIKRKMTKKAKRKARKLDPQKRFC